jgi:hypothetical protein
MLLFLPLSIICEDMREVSAGEDGRDPKTVLHAGTGAVQERYRSGTDRSVKGGKLTRYTIPCPPMHPTWVRFCEELALKFLRTYL